MCNYFICGCLTYMMWIDSTLKGKKPLIEDLAKEFNPKFSALGIECEYYDHSGYYTKSMPGSVTNDYDRVFGIMLTKKSGLSSKV